MAEKIGQFIGNFEQPYFTAAIIVFLVLSVIGCYIWWFWIYSSDGLLEQNIRQYFKERKHAKQEKK